LSLLVSMAVWVLFSWPLARYTASGIPASATNVEKGHVRQMVMGDHLQLLYNYWIFSDMLQGNTRFFRNLYEFNTGNDDERKYVGFDFMPYTAVFALGDIAAGPAFGWNLVNLFSLWMAFFFGWLLARRYVPHDAAAGVAALVCITLPYLWVALLGGSPTGMTMAFVPMLLWGIDTAVREGRLIGGLTAALALLCSYLNDAHILLFSFLALPGWSLFVLWQDEDHPRFDVKRLLKIVAAFVPLIITVLFIVVIIQSSKSAEVSGTTVESGRSAHEVALFTPASKGLYSWHTSQITHSIYFGYTVFILLIAGIASQLRLLVRAPAKQWRAALAMAAILFGVWLLVALALGPNGPGGGRVFDMARHWVPDYGMIRQPAKVYGMLAALLTVAAAMALRSLLQLISSKRMILAVVFIIGAGMLLEYRLRIEPTICLLDREQGAYAAVVEDAAQSGKDARAIALPIWPGDSAWSSLYEYYGMLYRIRMINGYQPVVSHEYIDEIYNAYEYMNGGIIRDEQLDSLRKRGIDYVILHEDAFPEQVSSFAVSFTLKRLLDCQRLHLLRQAQNVWAFKILDKPEQRQPVTRGWNWAFPSHNSYIEAEWFARTNAVDLEGDDVSGGHYEDLKQNGAELRLNPFYHCNVPQATLFVRERGRGDLRVNLTADTGSEFEAVEHLESDVWEWREISLTGPVGSVTADLRLSRLSGTVDVDAVQIAGGSLLHIAPGETVRLPAPLFFHAGYTDLKENAVVVRALHESSGVIFYGPNLPLTQGHYRIGFEYGTQAPAGTLLGTLQLKCGSFESEPVDVVAGKSPAVIEFQTPELNLPMQVAFRYSRRADMKIYAVTVTHPDK